jgi:hypothetical protein
MRWALRNLTSPEFKVYTYMISVAIRPRKSDARWFPNGKEIYRLYREGRILASNVSVRRIAKECKLSERTVAKAVKRFSDVGIVLKITNYKGRRSNIYLVGVENMWSIGEGLKPDCYFTELCFIQDGNAIPDPVRYFIFNNRYDAQALAQKDIPQLGQRLGDLFVGSYDNEKRDKMVKLWQVRG